MYIFGRKIYAGNDFILKMWLVAVALILAVVAVLAWNDRFRENRETAEAVYSPFGVEVRGRAVANFTGSRGFFRKMRKMGLSAADRRFETEEMFAALGCGNDAVPVLWLYATGKTKQDRDRSVQTFGNVFFAPEKLCFSIVDSAGVAIQADAKTFRVLWAQDGGAIVAIPLLNLPPDCASNGVAFRLETRAENGQWQRLGKDIEIPPFPVPANDVSQKETTGADATESEEAEGEEEKPAENPPAVAVPVAGTLPAASASSGEEFFPEKFSVESLSFPQECRFFSAPLWKHSAFGQLRLRMRGNASGNVPAAAWTLENFSISAHGQTFPAERADALHRNVRFLSNETFEHKGEGGAQTVPVAKVLFPRRDASSGVVAEPWTLKMRFFRQKFFFEDFFTLPEMTIPRVKNAPPKTFSFAGTEAKIRAFFDEDYFRRVEAKVPALVVEIRQDAGWDATHFWDVFRVSTDTGEDLCTESVVCVEPGVRQYWFLPSKKTPKKLTLVCAVTPYFYAQAQIVPEFLPAETQTSGNRP